MLIDVWLGEDRRTNIVKTHAQKRMDYVLEFYHNSTLNSAVIECTYALN